MRIARSNEDPSRRSPSVVRAAFVMRSFGRVKGGLQEDGQRVRGHEPMRLRIVRVVVLFPADETPIASQVMGEDHGVEAAAGVDRR
jgi:hypothetical protein